MTNHDHDPSFGPTGPWEHSAGFGGGASGPRPARGLVVANGADPGSGIGAAKSPRSAAAAPEERRHHRSASGGATHEGSADAASDDEQETNARGIPDAEQTMGILLRLGYAVALGLMDPKVARVSAATIKMADDVRHRDTTLKARQAEAARESGASVGGQPTTAAGDHAGERPAAGKPRLITADQVDALLDAVIEYAPQMLQTLLPVLDDVQMSRAREFLHTWAQQADAGADDDRRDGRSPPPTHGETC